MANYTCLLLDVDNTLLDFNAAERAAVGITLEHYGIPNGPEALEPTTRSTATVGQPCQRRVEPQQAVCGAVWPRDAGSCTPEAGTPAR